MTECVEGAPVALLREDGFLVRAGVMLVRPEELPLRPSFAADDGGGAVSEAGRRTGLVGDFVRGFAPLAAVDIFGLSTDGADPRVARVRVLDAALSEARLGLWVSALARSLATSRADGGLVTVLIVDVLVAVDTAEVGVGLLGP